ncbi:MAG: hypothetical protein ACJA0P_003370 [Planctomycetota bacterium]|jgi:hypothetical protein
MTHIKTPRGLARFLPALMVAPVLLVGPQHVAESEGARVTALWRSERALDQYAREGLTIVEGVRGAMASRAADSDSTATVPEVSLGMAESPLDLRWLGDPSKKAIDLKQRRKRRRAGLEVDEEAADAPAQPLVLPSVDGLEGVGPVVAIAPRVNDRVMFGTGMPPTTRWNLALEASRIAGGADEDILGLALAGMGAAKFGRSLEKEPFTSTALFTLQSELLGLGEELRAGRLEELAARGLDAMRMFDPVVPTVAPVGLVARHVVEEGLSVADLLSLSPEWKMESGAVGSRRFGADPFGANPLGWHAVATRKSDALVLSADPLSGESFTLTTSLLVVSNDLKTPAQADIVLGDRDGDRYLIVFNSQQGIYAFKRPGRDMPYETIAEKKEVVIPVGRPVEVKVLWRDHTLVITVGGFELAGIVLPDDAMAGSYGFGAHAGSSVLFSSLKFE